MICKLLKIFLLYGDSSLGDKSNTLILNVTIDFLLSREDLRLTFFKLNMAVLYILVKFIALFFYYHFFYSQAYHSRYMTGDYELYVERCM